MSAWNELSPADKGLWSGVAQGWWDWVDLKRRQPIPFPRVFNIKDAPPHFTMAHALVELKVFDSVSKARTEGWGKPLIAGEFWLKKRTVLVLLVWVDEDLLDE